MISGKLSATVESPLRILKIGRKSVTLEFEGETSVLYEGDVVPVRMTLNFHKDME